MSSSSLCPLSVVILAKDEEGRIGRCLASLRWASEVIVLLDDSTTDQTGARVKEALPHAQVVSVPWEGYGPTKNKGVERAVHDWVLWIDADEVVPEDLAAEVQDVVHRSEGPAAYDLPRLTYFVDGWVRHCGWYPDRVVRLFRKSLCRLDERPLHEKVILPSGAAVGHLMHDLLHYSYDDVGQYFSKMLRYGPLGARAAFESGQRCPFFQVVLRPLVTFFRSYCLRLGFLDGKRGFIVSLGSAFSTFVRYSHLYYLIESKVSVESSPSKKRSSSEEGASL